MHHRRTAILLGLATPVLLAFAGMLYAPGVAVDIAARLAPGVIYSAEIEQPVVALTISLTRSDFLARFGRMDHLLEELNGTRWFRPGSGWFSPTMLEDVERQGYRLVLGSVYTFDAQIPSADFIARYVLENVRAGSIIILHDGAGRAMRTAAALDRVLPELRRRGYRVVTVTELLRQEAAGSLVRPAARSAVSD